MEQCNTADFREGRYCPGVQSREMTRPPAPHGPFFAFGAHGGGHRHRAAAAAAHSAAIAFLCLPLARLPRASAH